MDKLEHEAWFEAGGEAETVKGFLTSQSSQVISALLRLQLEQDVRGQLVEIGTYMGRTFVGLVKASRDGEATIGFDLYPADVEAGFQQAIQHLSEAQRARVTAVRTNTLEYPTAKWIQTLRGPARFVHIDGGHNHAAIVNDLHLAASYLARNAVIVLDDFLHDWYPDLTEGIIDGLRASPNIVPIAVIPRQGAVQNGGTKLVCATPDGAGAYKTMLATKYSDKSPLPRRLAGHEVLTFQRF